MVEVLSSLDMISSGSFQEWMLEFIDVDFDITPEVESELRRLLKQASPRPWFYQFEKFDKDPSGAFDNHNVFGQCEENGKTRFLGVATSGVEGERRAGIGPNEEANMKLIVMAINLLPRLLTTRARVKSLESSQQALSTGLEIAVKNLESASELYKCSGLKLAAQDGRTRLDAAKLPNDPDQE